MAKTISKKGSSVAGTRVLKCGCKSAMQDELHGSSNRVCNRMGKGGATTDVSYRCTVCGRVHQISAPKKEVNDEQSSNDKP